MSEALHNGNAVYHLTWDKDNEVWHDCVQVVRDGLLAAKRVNRVGRDSCFSNTPRNIAVLLHSKAHVVLVAYANNGVLR